MELKTHLIRNNQSMIKHVFSVLILVIGFNGYAQISFEKAYFISNSDERKEGLIRNVDWNNNPTQFSFKSAENAEEVTITLESAKEFGIYDKSKYVRRHVDMDRSGRTLKALSEEKKPVFQKEQHYLKVLVEGKASLYEYTDGNILRFFFNTGDSPVEQLVYKKYRSSKTEIAENERFKQQLWNALNCEGITKNEVEKTNYRSKDLIDLFVEYNACVGSDYVNFENKQKQNLFHLTLRPGINSTSATVYNSQTNTLNADFDNSINFRVGIEAEYIMPFNKNKWSVIVEPTYQYFKSNYTSSRSVIEKSIDYTSIELPVGIRHYLFLDETSKLFINGSFVTDFSSKASIFNNFTEIKTGFNLAFGLGYKYDDKYSLEFRYFTSRELFHNYKFYDSDYKTVSVIVGYTFF